MRRAVIVLTLAAVTGCHPERITAVDPVFTSASAYAWSGGTVDLTSASFAGAASLPRFVVGMDTLEVSRVDSTVVRVALPDSTGLVELRAVLGDGRNLPAGTVTLVGFDSWHEGVPLAGNPIRVPGTTGILGNGAAGLLRYDLRLDAATTALPDSASEAGCSFSPAVSLVPGVLSGSRHPIPAEPFGLCQTYAWQVGPPLTLVDSSSMYGAWAAVYLGGSRWIANTKHRTWLFDGATTTDLGALEEPEQFDVSPDGTRLFPELGWDRLGAPVYDAILGAIAYRLPMLGYINGVVFAPTGDTAFVVGLGPPATTDTLYMLAIDPGTGAVLRQTVLPLGFPSLMVADPGRPWLYMADRSPYSAGRVPHLRVIDRRTMEQVAVLRAPPGTAPIYNTLLLPVISPLERRVYIASRFGWFPPVTEPSIVYVFDLLP